MNFLSINLAYRFVVMTLMLLHVNFFCETMNVPLAQPIPFSTIKNEGYVSAPEIGIRKNTSIGIDLTGRIETDKYVFCFWSGYLSAFHVKDVMPSFKDGREGFENRKNELSKMVSLVNSNEVYQLATNWLTKMKVDVTGLESETRRIVRQQVYQQPPSGGVLGTVEILKTPLYDVEWYGSPYPDHPNYPNIICSMTVDGSTKGVISFEIIEKKFFLNDPIHLKDAEWQPNDYSELIQGDRMLIDAKKNKEQLGRITSYLKASPKKIEKEKERVNGILIKRPEELMHLSYIKNLISLSDEEFLKMDDTMKSNLVLRFVPPESFPPKKVEVKKKEKASVDKKQ